MPKFSCTLAYAGPVCYSLMAIESGRVILCPQHSLYERLVYYPFCLLQNASNPYLLVVCTCSLTACEPESLLGLTVLKLQGVPNLKFSNYDSACERSQSQAIMANSTWHLSVQIPWYSVVLLLLLMIWQSPGLPGWRKVNFITVTRRPHHPNIAAGLCCLATSPGFLPTLCEKWSGFFYVHRVFLSYTRDRRLKVSSERLGNED